MPFGIPKIEEKPVSALKELDMANVEAFALATDICDITEFVAYYKHAHPDEDIDGWKVSAFLENFKRDAQKAKALVDAAEVLPVELQKFDGKIVKAVEVKEIK